ncbi:MAG: hypothetical protein JW840_02940 [Candidatus Thermoplasmatota archaeon]|nr:hypothetical protein [Candidatus Thermoplasmatota archaeon]
MKIKMEFNLKDVYVDEFMPIFNQPILKIIQDIRRAERIIMEKVAEDIRTSELFRNLTYTQLEEEIEAWANRSRCKHKEMFHNDPR